MLPQTSFFSLLALSGLAGLSSAGYTLKDDYSPSNFFNMFNFFTDNDPTNGYVDYVSQSAAQGANLINTNNGKVYMGVDHTNVASGRGRKSVRLTSKATYNHALIVLDLEHMPGNSCGSWPAFWTLGANWPNNGEIDIIEGVNSQSHNAMTLHTSDGCTMSSGGGSSGSTNSQYTGSMYTSNCYVNAAGQAQNAGCQIQMPSGNNYGSNFNSAGGGIYATEWTSSYIKIWFFPHGSAPSDIASSNPNPNNWGSPVAYFGNSGCDINSHFRDHNLVFDTTFCGSWAGNAGVWGNDATCKSKASTCTDYVQNNPSAFENTYWSVNSLKVYTDGSASKRFEDPLANVTEAVAPSVVATTFVKPYTDVAREAEPTIPAELKARMSRHLARHLKRVDLK